MKFCDKLVKMRKNNNMSQEQLADRLGISRQAVSKWESGTSIPDMAKILELCKILNCSLDDLVDDTALGNKELTESKNNIHNYLKEVLDFITRTINMFWSMTLGEKLKCILEIIIITIFLYFIWGIGGEIIDSIFYNILIMLPENIYRIIKGICSVIYSLFGLIAGIIIIIHVFKIRYLDYFITIEDNNTTDKSIEEPIDIKKEENEKIKFIDKKKNKIIIRDPKHSTYTFFDFLGHIIMYIIKFALIIIAVPCIISFIALVFGEIFSISLIKDGIFFLGTTILLVGIILANYLILRIIYNFILNQQFKFNLIFILLIISLVLTGTGAGISFCDYMTFQKEVLTNDKIDYNTKNLEIDMTDKVVLEFLEHNNTEIIIDNNINNIKLEISYNKNGEINLYNTFESNSDYYGNEREYQCYNIDYYDNNLNEDFVDSVNYLIDTIKDKKRIYYNYMSIEKIKIYISENNLEKIKTNYQSFYN